MLFRSWHPDICAIPPVLVSEEAQKISHSTLGKTSFEGTAAKVNHSVQPRLPTFLETEELGTRQPKLCDSCQGCKFCSIGSIEMSCREAEELAAIKKNMVLDRDAKEVRFTYPLLGDPGALEDNREQAVAMAKGLEKRLKKQGLQDKYNTEFQDYLDREIGRAHV